MRERAGPACTDVLRPSPFPPSCHTYKETWVCDRGRDRPRVSHLRLPRAMIWLRVLEIFWWFAKKRHTTGTHSPQTAHQHFRMEVKTTQLLPTSGVANP